MFFHFSYLAEQIRGEDKIIQPFIGSSKHIIFCPFPFFMPLVDVENTVTDSHYGVHIVGIDNGCHVVFSGNVVNQFIDNQLGLWVQTGIGFVAK